MNVTGGMSFDDADGGDVDEEDEECVTVHFFSDAPFWSAGEGEAAARRCDRLRERTGPADGKDTDAPAVPRVIDHAIAAEERNGAAATAVAANAEGAAAKASVGRAAACRAARRPAPARRNIMARRPSSGEGAEELHNTIK
jgi:hypothetical protein